MSSLRPVGRSAATLDKDRASLCSFTFADGRRCRTPRQSGHLQFCCFHARKQAQTQAAEEIGRDASYFFSGRYLSACDLNAALGRVFAATAQGHIKPKTAATLAYLAQVMVQCIQISQHEYAEAFGGDGWRRSVSSSVNDNSDYLYPPQPEQPQNLASQPVTPTPPAAPPPPAPSPHTPMPPTRTEFVQHVVAGRNLSRHGRETGENVEAARNSSRVPQASRGSSPQPVSVAPNPAPQVHPDAGTAAIAPPSPRSGSAHSPASATQPAPSSQLPTAPPTSSAIQSSAAAQQSSQQAREPLRPVAAKPSAPRSETPQRSGPQTGPSGAPVLAPLPLRKPGPPPGFRSS